MKGYYINLLKNQIKALSPPCLLNYPPPPPPPLTSWRVCTQLTWKQFFDGELEENNNSSVEMNKNEILQISSKTFWMAVVSVWQCAEHKLPPPLTVVVLLETHQTSDTWNLWRFWERQLTYMKSGWAPGLTHWRRIVSLDFHCRIMETLNRWISLHRSMALFIFMTTVTKGRYIFLLLFLYYISSFDRMVQYRPLIRYIKMR